MICRIGGTVHCGRVVTVERSVEPKVLAEAVRSGATTVDGTFIEIDCCRPHLVHERVGCIEPDVGLRPRAALAEAGRARGLGTPVDDGIRRIRRTLADFSVEAPETRDARRAVADASSESARLRERAATLRGRIQARRDAGLDPDDAAADLAEAIGDLSAVETRAAAARQERDRRRRNARAARDRLEDRLRLEDELANCRRAARSHLVDRLRPAFESALAAVPGLETPADPFEAPPVPTALAIARVADFDAPVILSCDRFPDPSDAARWLGCPVLRPAP